MKKTLLLIILTLFLFNINAEEFSISLTTSEDTIEKSFFVKFNSIDKITSNVLERNRLRLEYFQKFVQHINEKSVDNKYRKADLLEKVANPLRCYCYDEIFQEFYYDLLTNIFQLRIEHEGDDPKVSLYQRYEKISELCAKNSSALKDELRVEMFNNIHESIKFNTKYDDEIKFNCLSQFFKKLYRHSYKMDGVLGVYENILDDMIDLNYSGDNSLFIKTRGIAKIVEKEGRLLDKKYILKFIKKAYRKIKFSFRSIEEKFNSVEYLISQFYDENRDDKKFNDFIEKLINYSIKLKFESKEYSLFYKIRSITPLMTKYAYYIDANVKLELFKKILTKIDESKDESVDAKFNSLKLIYDEACDYTLYKKSEFKEIFTQMLNSLIVMNKNIDVADYRKVENLGDMFWHTKYYLTKEKQIKYALEIVDYVDANLSGYDESELKDIKKLIK